MRAYSPKAMRGFTLIELMLVVAIIGVLAALALYGVSRYLASSKTAEAKQSVGAITRDAVSVYEQESVNSQLLPEGTESATANHLLCGSAIPVPATVPAGRKYQPISVPGQDYRSGDSITGWQCLKFEINAPQYYQYQYLNGSSVVASNPAGCFSGPGTCFAAAAVGDLDGDGIFSGIERTGTINPVTAALRTTTQIYVENELE